MLEWMMTTDGWIAFATLFAMEVVLGIDNIVFISILASKLPVEQQARARTLGLSLALLMRLGLLFAITWVMGLTEPIATLFGQDFSGRDLVLLFGGLFLIGKATIEIHHMFEGAGGKSTPGSATFAAVIAQIIALDIVFSLDSIITAVGLTKDIGVMVCAVIASMAVMLVAAGPLSNFVNKHPTTKMLALAFLVMIGAMLVANGFGIEVPKGYIYSAMAFSVLVEILNVIVKSRGRSKAPASEAASPGSVLSDALAAAQRSGATGLQLATDEQGGVRAWTLTPTGLVENASFAHLDWTTVKGEIEARQRSGWKGLRDVKSAVAGPNMRGAALLSWG